MGRPALDHPRTGRLTVRWSDEDAARLERVRKLLSPRVEVSQGKAISAALAMAEELLLKNKSA
jgi:hypothetical protein